MELNQENERQERIRFFLRNLFRGLIWLAVVVGGYFYLEANYDITLKGILGDLYDQPVIIYSIFFVSEAVFGIIPPELFMIWALRDELIGQYILNVMALSVISYVAGMLGYYIGSHFSTTQFYRTVRKNYLGRFEKHLNRFGGFLVIVAALTPLPFAGICMLMGTVKYPYRRFLLFATFRFARFVVYAMVIWEAHIL
ncbi:YqaA family protein [Marinoscillum pacificum]|uniref:YqaA family protein n=1 Tax=Marinoscillum pacificum TaxID=392723 RepID=UPI0021581D6A|nr:VTT domain-containing protein [Marinoscillum pacificum]